MAPGRQAGSAGTLQSGYPPLPKQQHSSLPSMSSRAAPGLLHIHLKSHLDTLPATGSGEGPWGNRQARKGKAQRKRGRSRGWLGSWGGGNAWKGDMRGPEERRHSNCLFLLFL